MLKIFHSENQLFTQNMIFKYHKYLFYILFKCYICTIKMILKDNK